MTQTTPRERPLGITILAILAAIAGIFGLLGSVALLGLFSSAGGLMGAPAENGLLGS